MIFIVASAESCFDFRIILLLENQSNAWVVSSYYYIIIIIVHFLLSFSDCSSGSRKGALPLIVDNKSRGGQHQGLNCKGFKSSKLLDDTRLATIECMKELSQVAADQANQQCHTLPR